MAALNGQRTWAQILAEQESWLFNTGASSPTTYPSTAMLLNITNKWYKNLCSSHPWEWLTGEGTITTVAGTARIVMPDNAKKPEIFTIRNISKLVPIYTRQKFLAMYPSGWNNTGQGIPMIAVEAIESTNNSRQYDLWPTPGDVYTISYDSFQYVAPLVNTTDYSIIPPDYDQFLVHGPVSEAFAMQNDPTRSTYHKAEAEAIRVRAWMDNERMLSTMNQVRGNDNDAGQALIFPYHPY